MHFRDGLVKNGNDDAYVEAASVALPQKPCHHPRKLEKTVRKNWDLRGDFKDTLEGPEVGTVI